MRFFFFLFLIFTSLPALAQIDPPPLSRGKAGDIITKPKCTFLVNRSDQTMMGTVSTAPQTLPGGDVVRHRENFKLEAGKRQEICSTGPFYEGYRLEVEIKTLIPLFTCRTTLDREIFLEAEDGDGGFRKLTATCY